MKIRFFALCCSLFALNAFGSSMPLTKTIYGLNEHVSLPSLNLEAPAKLDTGAATSSLSAHNIEQFIKDGEDWVRFTLAIEGASKEVFEHPISRISRIKRRADDIPDDDEDTHSARPVIEVELCMGNSKQLIEMNLTDRTSFQYPVLIGSSALKQFKAIIDPSLKYAAGKPDCTIKTEPEAE